MKRNLAAYSDGDAIVGEDEGGVDAGELRVGHVELVFIASRRKYAALTPRRTSEPIRAKSEKEGLGNQNNV